MGLFSRETSRSRSGRIIEQLGTLALSVLLGLIVWLIAINQEDPIVQDEFPERIPVSVRGLDENLQPLQDLSNESVRVVIQAPKSSWDDLEVGDFTAYLDLTGQDAGVHDVAVTVESKDPRVKILTESRPQLRVQLDRVTQKAVPVRVDVMDSTAFGYDWQAPVVMPITVTVSGPSTQVDQVSVANAQVYLRNAKNQVERTEVLSALDAQGQALSRVSVDPQRVRVVVPVEEWPGRKEVAVRVSLEGQPAAGYHLSSVRVNPSTVVLLGSADVLGAVPGFVETEPVSLTDATSEIQRRVSLIVPDNVTVLEGEAIDVTASIAPIEGGTTVRQEPVIQGVGPGLEASVGLDTIEVILSGPLPLLESLGADDVFVILDLTGLLAGVHTVTPRVVVPDQIRSEGVIPQQVEVVIVDKSVIGEAPGSAQTPQPTSPLPRPITVTSPLDNGTPVTTTPATTGVATNTPISAPSNTATPSSVTATQPPAKTATRTPTLAPTLVPTALPEPTRTPDATWTSSP